MARLIGLLFWFGMLSVSAQSTGFTIKDAVEQARKNYPAVRASLEQAGAAAAAIDLARTAYLPRADFLGQVNRATRNNIFGLLLPQPGIPSISGPVLGTNNLTNVWGSAVGALASWEPFDFGLRRANVEIARSGLVRAQAGSALTEFEVSAAAADVFLSVLAAQETVRTANAAVERARILERSIDALVKAELRPGADASRAHAEVAAAETQRIQAEQAVQVTRAALAQYAGTEASGALVVGPLLGVLPDQYLPAASPSTHPLAREQNAAVEEAKAREQALQRSYYPRFALQAAAYGRGSGARTDGSTGGPLSGLGPDTQNWALGMTVTFPVLELPSLRAKRKIEVHRERAEAARYDTILRELESRLAQARAAFEGARRVAHNTPLQLEAARAAERQASARYRAGLSTIVEVADAQRLLTQAEIDDALARLQVWRALLGLSAAQGDLAPFLEMAGK
jgi:outer membrane protein